MADQSADRWDDRREDRRERRSDDGRDGREGRDGRDGRSPQERGFSGPDGVENADSILELEREERRDASTRADFAPDFPRDLGEEDLAAAEQGNRDGDEMTSDGDDPYEAAELSGDADDDTDEYADPDAYGRPRPGFRIEDPSRHGERR